MRGLSPRLAANLVWVLVASGVVVGGSLLRWVGPSLFGDTYELTVAVPEGGGILSGMPVTVLGAEIGTIARTEVTVEAVDVVLEVRGDEAAPATAMVHVLRRSPIGEQAIELTPVAADWEPGEDPVPSRVPVADDWVPAEPGSRIDAVAVVTPSSVPRLLEQAQTFLSALPVDRLSVLIDELGTALEGRVDTVKQLNRDAASLGETLVEAIPDTERLLEASGPVLDALHDQRRALAESLTDTADLAETLAGTRGDVDTLLDQSPSALRDLDAFIRDQRANLSCLNDDLIDLGSMTAEPENLEELERLLDLNRFFYGGFDAGTQWDPYRPGVVWARVNILFMEEPAGQPAVPRTPTPPTLPGAHCDSPFGLGVNAVRQDDPMPPDPTSPGIDYAPLVDGADGGVESPGSGGSKGPGASGRGALPATGSGPLGLVPAVLLGGAWLLRRRR